MTITGLRRVVRSIAFIVAAVPAAAAFAQQEAATDELPDLTEITRQVAEIRGLEFKRPVPSERQTIEGFREYMLKDLEGQFPEGMFDNIMDGLLRLGLLSERIDLGGAFVDAILSQAAAYYDPISGKFYYLMMDMPLSALHTVASHELVHALQDQHFDLKSLVERLGAMGADPAVVRNDDWVLAVRCLVEGEATYVMTLWQMKDMMNVDLHANPEMEAMQIGAMANMDVDQLVEMSRAAAGQMGDDMAEAIESMESIPRYILQPLYTAYMTGAYFTMKLRHEGGWERVAEEWKRFPPSTELCLHPDKYVGDTVDIPTTINLPAFENLSAAGWKRIDAATHGEVYLNMLLREQGVSKKDAKDASEGWDGDVYAAYRGAEAATAIVLATTWDSEKDAEEFFEAYQNAIEEKYPNHQPVGEEGESRFAYDCGENLGRGLLLRRGQEVFAVEGFDAGTTAQVVAALESMPIERVGTVDKAAYLAAGEEVNRVESDGLSFAVQPGWIEEEPENEMRVAQFRLPPAEGVADEARLIVFHFPEMRGDVQANIDRWADQFDTAAEPQVSSYEVGGNAVTVVDISGRYVAETRPASGEYYDEPGWRLLASIVQTSEGPYFFRMVGPGATIAKWADSFHNCMKSIR
jgi:hypothetical protein